MARYVKSARAEEDLFEIWHFIAQDNEAAATKVINAAYSTFALLARNPELGRIRRSFKGLRAFPVSGFRNYLICYQVADDTIEIVRVLNGARDLEKVFEQ
jgi:toxin ParE1/3/4